ncbi:hypothetical protein SPSYN_01527 [Sporotomaculum syntrophicum]|uniref:DUF1540 domain-containing protein n=1 Tax=Sporotomaculum syntrophicum TaxID=182264 RepID=A0A9D3AWG4_9FIRM|nr:DUF1540 domain-containing protein [Sporotomaculum syntrophicum]KAF1085390.1 hypothetical protein SPSYN_01527 [Sporotomaculum syntrophicum]
MNQHIHCIINNCHYWANGNKCEANEILVANDSFASKQQDSIDATMAKQLTPASADSCMSTCCKTFVHKNSDQISADSIYKMS